MSPTQPAQDRPLAPGSLITSRSTKYQVQSFLGQGTFGRVVRCKTLDNKRTVAIKMIKLQGLPPRSLKMAKEEVSVLIPV